VQHTVLLVDDEALVLQGLMRVLSRQPYRVLTAQSGEEAISLLDRDAVDVIVIDERMPGMSGCELIHWVAENRPGIVRIMLSGHATMQTVIRAVNEGDVFYFLVKPCPDLLLVTTINRAIEYHDVLVENECLSKLNQRALTGAISKALPRADEDMTEAGAPAAPPADVLAGARILNVDDTALNAELLADELRERGCEVITAGSGEEALTLAAAEQPDVVLLDVMMPGIDGLEVCRRLKADPATAAIAVVLVTCLTSKQSILSGFEAGADDYIAKPFAPEVLVARLRAVLRTKRAYDQLARFNHQLRAEIDQRKLAEENLRRNERRLHVISKAAGEYLWETDRQGRYTLLTEHVQDVLGHAPEELLGRSAFEFMPREDVEANRKALDAEVRRGRPIRHFEHRSIHRSGQIRWQRISGEPIRDASGSIVGYRGSATDITDYRQAVDTLRENEQALAQYALALEEANRDLQRLKEQAVAATLAKSEFLARMSHEIRSPLTAILGYADLLAEPALSEAQRQAHVDTIRRNGEALQELIDDILDLSKVEAGRMTLERVDCSPWQIAADVQTMMRPRAEAKGVRLELRGRFPLPATIRTDPTRLRQILVNLVGNAVKFTDSGSVEIEVGLARVESGESKLEVVVRDTGIGMSPDEMGRLFQPFTQADSTTTRRFGGTGLGLTISKQLAVALGGDIRVESQPGRGSTFTLTVHPGPLVGVPRLESPPPPTDETPTGPSGHAPQVSLHGRVLLAEDSVDSRRLISILLGKFGLDVDVAPDGRTALAMVAAAADQGRPYDLILMDMHMPHLDGYDATRTLRQLGWEGPIVALTASAMANDRQRCLEAGCTDFHTKPIDQQAFREMLLRHLEPAHAPALPSVAE